MESILEVSNVSKWFHAKAQAGQRVKALDEVSFTLEQGSALVIKGKSGSGKSTLLKCIYRTCIINDGSIRYRSAGGWVNIPQLDDHRVIRLRMHELHYCSQFLEVIPRVGTLDVIAGNMIRRGEPKQAARQAARDLCERLGIGKQLWEAYPATMSGGEQQRVNVARALIARPTLLLIDEPTASLDQQSKDAVIEQLLRLKNEGTTLVCISHDDYTIERIADKKIELNQGTIINTLPNE